MPFSWWGIESVQITIQITVQKTIVFKVSSDNEVLQPYVAIDLSFMTSSLSDWTNYVIIWCRCTTSTLAKRRVIGRASCWRRIKNSKWRSDPMWIIIIIWHLYLPVFGLSVFILYVSPHLISLWSGPHIPSHTPRTLQKFRQISENVQWACSRPLQQALC